VTITFVQEDTSPVILATLHDDTSSAVPINLTNATVKFQMRRSDDKYYRVNAACSVVDAAAGKVSYTWAAGDLKVPGDYIVQFEVTFTGGRIQTTATAIPVTVRRQ
jgi:hypothetical protein